MALRGLPSKTLRGLAQHESPAVRLAAVLALRHFEMPRSQS